MDSPKRVRALLAFMAFGLLAFAFILLLVFEVQDGARDVIMVLIGAIISQAKEAYGFFFGTSQSSQDKQRIDPL